MKRALVGMMAVVALSVVGCSKDAEFEEFMKANSALGEEISGAKNAGDARKAFDAKKDDLKKKFDAIKDARGFQVKEETKTKWAENIVENTTKVCFKISLDAKEAAEYKKICDEYTESFDVK
ncbi:MAG: hypothetical protein IPM79_17680 [Polyangiaceae bacterium]|jgi:hypothetical protein|nr:hypothetical protein [Polyangiaceae bacterium]MBK8939399.1 hypothetical protein [Polyangiaceae bacterium]